MNTGVRLVAAIAPAASSRTPDRLTPSCPGTPSMNASTCGRRSLGTTVYRALQAAFEMLRWTTCWLNDTATAVASVNWMSHVPNPRT